MATITTFSTLKTAVADWLDRDDISAAGGPIDVMVEMAEDQIYRDLRLRFMEAATSPVISAGVIAIPSDFLELKQAHVVTNPITRLEPKNTDWINTNYPTRAADGVPKYMAQQGDNWILGPYPDSAYTCSLQYYSRPTALGTGNETNWLTTNASDVLLNATLLQSIGYLGRDEREEYWNGNYERGMTQLKAQEKRQRFAAQQAIRTTVG